MAEIYGTSTEQFIGVREALAKNLDSGADIGASAAVFIDGEPVVDIWGGYFDEARTRPWERDTIINTFSTTKTMTALCALILAAIGEIDLNAPVARYWPEFAAEGKDLFCTFECYPPESLEEVFSDVQLTREGCSATASLRDKSP